MRNRQLSIVVVAVLTLLFVTPAMARVFSVQLKNGNSFETRYRPKVAAWDENKVIVLTDVGNRITLHKDDIVEVVSHTEMKGFGTVIDTTTIVLGWAPNDAPAGDAEPDPQAQFREYLDAIRGQQRTNTVQQFVNSEDAGGGGLSTWEFGAGNFTGGPQGGGGNSTVIVTPPMMEQQPAGGGEGGDGS